MFAPSRNQARQFLFDTWHKHQQAQPLTDLERKTLGILLAHPEYQPILDAPERYLDKDYLPEFGETNPFLHLSMHLALEEQLSIDQPQGLRGCFERLCTRLSDAHKAQHEVLDCLGEMIWQAQRQGRAPDSTIYLACLRRKLGEPAPDTA